MALAADLVYQLKTVADPAISPDGGRVVYAQSWIEGTGSTAQACSRLMMAALEDGEAGERPAGGATEFTQGSADGGPRFSPYGGRLAFLRAREAGQPRQIWVIGAHGGEARQLTSAPRGVQDFAWSPDSARIVYCADTEPAAGAAAGSQSEGPRVVEVSRVRFRHDLQGWRGDAHHHLFVVEVDSGDTTQITRGDWDDYGPVWSPDGSSIAFISGRRGDRDLRALTEAYVVNAGGGMAGSGVAECWSGSLESTGAVAWSPDSRQLVAVASEDPAGMVLWQGWLYILQPGENPRRITTDGQRPALSSGPGAARQPDIRWMDDGRILFLGERRGESFLYQATAEGGEAGTLWGGGCLASGLSLDRDGRRAAVASSSPCCPSEVQVLDLPEGGSTPVARPNRDFLKRQPLASLEKFTIERGGCAIECRLWVPPFFDYSVSHPLILDIHGGPNGAFYDSFLPWQQALAGSGYLVLAVNPRGSSTYGNDFMRAVLDDWGGEDYLDLMAAVDHVCQRDYVDPERLGIHGYSYGGFMTGWTIGHTDRFAAAVMGAPCTNLYTMYGTSDIGISFGESQWGGSVMDTPEKLLARSPISYVRQVSAPVLLLHGESDFRCPVAQSEEYFVAMKRLGRTVEFVRFPGSNHAFPRTGHPRMREEYLSRLVAWFDDWLA